MFGANTFSLIESAFNMYQRGLQLQEETHRNRPFTFAVTEADIENCIYSNTALCKERVKDKLKEQERDRIAKEKTASEVRAKADAEAKVKAEAKAVKDATQAEEDAESWTPPTNLIHKEKDCLEVAGDHKDDHVQSG